MQKIFISRNSSLKDLKYQYLCVVFEISNFTNEFSKFSIYVKQCKLNLLFFKIRQNIINRKPFKNTAKSCMNYVEQKEKKDILSARL